MWFGKIGERQGLDHSVSFRIGKKNSIFLSRHCGILEARILVFLQDKYGSSVNSGWVDNGKREYWK